MEEGEGSPVSILFHCKASGGTVGLRAGVCLEWQGGGTKPLGVEVTDLLGAGVLTRPECHEHVRDDKG